MNDERREVRIAAILGTTRPGNVTSKVLALAVDELSGNPEVRVTWLDPAGMELPFPGQSGDFPDRERLQAAIREADGLIFATPEYHGSYAAAMKLVIENLGFPSALAGKPAALIGAASGAIGAVKALEHLRSVLSHVGAIVLPGPVSVAGVHKVFDAEGRCLDEAVERRTRKLAANLLDYVERSTCPRAGLEAFVRRG
ncbi:MAG: NAD(P)H-dependent oxidoreductase [Acidobacteriota bacterium]|nr:NAD(P)H-dependent oxidoreductase [Acidobacteriota bacterium]